MPPLRPFNGAVLCGGASTRMGRDKASIEIDGETMAVRVAGALRLAGASETFAVGGRAQGPALRTIDDRWPGEGPLGGVITALCESRRHTPDIGAVAVLACDLLDPDASTIRHLAERHTAGDADATVPLVGGHRQWMHAVWAVRCLDVLARVFESGERSIVGAVAGLRIEWVDDIRPDATDDADVPTDLPSVASGPADVPTDLPSGLARSDDDRRPDAPRA